nr:DUF2523 domain-containing protein [uncultured Rhodoferax sp.]
MAFLIPLIGNMLLAIAGSIALQIFVGLGIGVVTYAGIDTAIGWLKAGAVSALLGLPPEIVGMLSLMKVGSCVSMVFSALAIRITLSGIATGSKQFVKK